MDKEVVFLCPKKSQELKVEESGTGRVLNQPY